MNLFRQNRIFRKIGYAGNLLGEPLAPGDICFKDEGIIRKMGSLTDFIPGIVLSVNPPQSKVELRFDAESNVDVRIGAQSGEGLRKGEVELKFKSASSAFVCLQSVEISTLNFGLIQEELRNLWKLKHWNKEPFKHLLVSSVVSAKSGVVIFSGERNNRVILSAKHGAPELTSVAELGSGKVDIVHNSRHTQEVISETPIQPLFGCLRLNALGRFDVVV